MMAEMYTSDITFQFVAAAFGSVLLGSLAIAFAYALIRYFADEGVGLG